LKSEKHLKELLDADIRKKYDLLQDVVTRAEKEVKVHSLKKTMTHKTEELKE